MANKSRVDTMAITRGAWLLCSIAFLTVFYELIFKDGVRGVKRTRDTTSLQESDSIICDSYKTI